LQEQAVREQQPAELRERQLQRHQEASEAAESAAAAAEEEEEEEGEAVVE
jgi:hypothetical protein